MMRPMARAVVACFALLWLVCTAGSCDRPSYSGNAPSLWINYSSSELDLVLVDYEPPPF